MLRFTLLALALLSAFVAPAFAAGLTASQTVEVAIVSLDENGEIAVAYEAAEEVAPGDEVRYVLAYANQGDEAATNVRLEMPVPAEINLIEGSIEAANANVSYSIDDGASFSTRGDLTITANGQNRAATAEEITHIRWSFAQAIAPGDSGTISYRGVLQ